MLHLQAPPVASSSSSRVGGMWPLTLSSSSCCQQHRVLYNWVSLQQQLGGEVAKQQISPSRLAFQMVETLLRSLSQQSVDAFCLALLCWQVLNCCFHHVKPHVER